MCPDRASDKSEYRDELEQQGEPMIVAEQVRQQANRDDDLHETVMAMEEVRSSRV